MARLSLKLYLLCLTILSICCTLVTFFLTCGHHGIGSSTKPSQFGENQAGGTLNKGKRYEEIDCSINGQYRVTCRRELDNVYVPFSFLEKYYEVYGKMVNIHGKEQFEWSHSYSKIYRPKSNYNSSGIYMYFSNYNVEVRDRVKCVSAIEGTKFYKFKNPDNID